MKKNVYVIIDGQAGSCGKGKVIGQFALQKKVDAAVTNNMPNAGHTFMDNGKKRIFRNIPVSAVNPNTALFIGPGSIIDMDVLVEEYEANQDILDGREIVVHPLVPLVQQKHIEQEKRQIKTGSTFKGCCPCQTEKMMRSPDAKFFKEYKSIKADPDYYKKLYHYLHTAKKILLEGAQGCDLDMNHSHHYPYTTSRQVCPEQMLADSGIPASYLKEIIMVIRPFPIRISNEIYDGSTIYSGDYGTSPELTWDQINVGAYLGMYPTTVEKEDIETWKDIAPDLTEYTTVTKKKRRIFDLDIDHLKFTVERIRPTSIYLNFFQQLDSEYQNIHGVYNGYGKIYFDKYRKEYLSWLENELGVPITMLGTGPKLEHYINREPYVKILKKEEKAAKTSRNF